MSSVRSAPVLLACGHLPRQALVQVESQASEIGENGALMGEMKRANAYEEKVRMTDRFASTLVIVALIIAAVRLACDQDISRPSPRLASVVADSIGLARMILERIVR
jgi:hypothetical protein